MYHIEVTNVNKALCKGLVYLANTGITQNSRNGPVLVSPCPVVTTYTRPTQRVLFSPVRDANPFFHLMESLWMLSGSDSLEFPLYFNSRFGNYSDDGETVWGAYGYRWRKWFSYDQLYVLIDELQSNKETRRAVLGMWDPRLDLAKAGEGGKDVPCNTHAYFDCLDGRLNMTVCCRSNDILWGAYGANAVHFSMLLEFMAAAVGIDVGVYRQFSNNYHLYTDVVPLNKMHTLAVDSEYHDLYAQKLRTYPLVSTDYKSWLRDLDSFMADPAGHSYFDPFFNEVALPMYLAWYARKEKLGDGLDWVARIKADDWSMACYRWIVRRKQPIKTVNQTV